MKSLAVLAIMSSVSAMSYDMHRRLEDEEDQDKLKDDLF